MSRIALLLTIVLTASLVPGCIVASSREVVRRETATSTDGDASSGDRIADPMVAKGDVQMVQGDAVAALSDYVGAARNDPRLTDNKAFQKRVARAKAAQACREGDTLAEAGQWDKAVLKYLDAQGFDKEYGPLAAKFDLVRKQAAAVHVANVAEIIRKTEAEHGSSSAGMAAAMAELRMALNYDPDNAEAKLMLQGISKSLGLGAAPPAPAAVPPPAK